MIVETHKREAQFDLLGVSFSIEIDQRSAHEPAEPGCGSSTGESAPDHVAGNPELVAAQMEFHVFREERE